MHPFIDARRIMYLGLTILTLGCASFPRNPGYEQFLDRGDLFELNGKYEHVPIYSGPTKDTLSYWNFSNGDLGIYPTFFDEMDNGWLTRKTKIDPEKNYSFVLDVVKYNILSIHYLENDSVIRQKNIRFRMRKDGYLYLQNMNFKIRGIPYVFGDIDKKRIRLTLNKDRDLVFETSEFNSGGMFLLSVNPISKMKYEKIFLRIE